MKFQVFFCLFTLFPSVTSQVSLGQSISSSTAQVQRDPQAISVLNQVLTAAGGAAALAQTQDLTASGTITFNWADQDVAGTATLKARGTNQFRIQASFPDGIRVWTTNNGQRVEKEVDGSVIIAFYNLSTVFDNLQFPLAGVFAALQDSATNLTYVALESKEGSNVHHIRVTRGTLAIPSVQRTNQVASLDLFIDANTNQIRSVVTVASSNGSPGQTIPREIRYSDYRPASGFVIPFSITELIDGQQTFSIQITQVSFNTGLTDSDFEP